MMGVRRHFRPMRRIVPSASESSRTVLPMVGVFPGAIHKEGIFHEQLRSVMQRDEGSEFVAGADAAEPLHLHCLDNVSVLPRQLQQHASASLTAVAGQTLSSKAAFDTTCPGVATRHRKTSRVLGRSGSAWGPRQRHAFTRSRCSAGAPSDISRGIQHSLHHNSGYPKCRRGCRPACTLSSSWPSWSLVVCSSPAVPLAWA